MISYWLWILKTGLDLVPFGSILVIFDNWQNCWGKARLGQVRATLRQASRTVEPNIEPNIETNIEPNI